MNPSQNYTGKNFGFCINTGLKMLVLLLAGSAIPDGIHNLNRQKNIPGINPVYRTKGEIIFPFGIYFSKSSNLEFDWISNISAFLISGFIEYITCHTELCYVFCAVGITVYCLKTTAEYWQ